MNGKRAKEIRRLAYDGKDIHEDREYSADISKKKTVKMPLTMVPAEGGKTIGIDGRLIDFDGAELDKSQTNKFVPVYSLTVVAKGARRLYQALKKEYKSRFLCVSG